MVHSLEDNQDDDDDDDDDYYARGHSCQQLSVLDDDHNNGVGNSPSLMVKLPGHIFTTH